MVNIYASSTAKTVLVYICLACLAIGFIWSVIACKFENKLSTTGDSTGTKIAKLIGKHGGVVLSCVSWLLLVVYEIAWRPYSNLENIPSEELNKLISEHNKQD